MRGALQTERWCAKAKGSGHSNALHHHRPAGYLTASGPEAAVWYCFRLRNRPTMALTQAVVTKAPAKEAAATVAASGT
eukprot:CAMPEP_0206027554 /NCGR_PEP_ID=MMETSP1464-20131121/43464_1 /ASSEMBLY_ACC=CAM_ASM_001124 /TAXON_ID=119497 /ORGANISM="Exanthemachrysis gayraliae, Strain RCC1523" /LENGTH=77 /DNA_ID=CAMNT_0053401597 /DNA_START=127 /DNA_END=358 /DNA_ORIENTATION=+